MPFDALTYLTLGGENKSTEYEEVTVGPAPVVSVTDAAPLNAEDVLVDIEPVQAGSGDPSPENVRPITGWTGVKVTVNEDVIDITFPSEAGTVYGGMLDVTSGVLTVDRAIVDLGTLNWEYFSRFDCYGSYLTRPKGQQEAKIMFDALCSNYPFVGIYNNLVDKSCSYIYNQAIAVRDSAYADTAAFKTAMSGVQLCYELATPVTYDLTLQEIALLRGGNTLWADTGDTTLTYNVEVESEDDSSDSIIASHILRGKKLEDILMMQQLKTSNSKT